MHTHTFAILSHTHTKTLYTVSAPMTYAYALKRKQEKGKMYNGAENFFSFLRVLLLFKDHITAR